MKGYFSNIKKYTAIVFAILFLVTPITPIFSAELNSTNFTIEEGAVGSGNESNSTNFSITGNIDQVHTGLFSVSNLPLAPGIITSCGKITTSGTYTLDSNLIGISGTCFIVQADNVVIDGNGYSVIAGNSNTSYAITATSSNIAGSAYGTTTISNITFSGFGGGINASGNNAVSGNTNGGNGGKVFIEDSTLGNVITSSGLGSGTGSAGLGGHVVINDSTTGNVTNSGSGGSITLSDDDLNISNTIYTTSGSFAVSYTGVLTTTNTTISAVSNFITNGTNHGSYVGGAFPLIPGTISSCGTLYFSGTYTLSSNITGNCTIAKTGITIDGAGNTLTGNVSAGTFGVTLSNITVSGSVSTTGAGAGALTVNNASNLTGTISVTGLIQGDGSSSLGNTTISAGGSVASSSVSFVGDVINSGTIGSGISVLGKITNNGTISTGGGTFTFNASSTNSGTVNGNAVLSASSTSTGTITGNAQFNAYTAINGEVLFAGTTAFAGTGIIGGTIYDSTGTTPITMWVFNASSTNTGVLSGNATFNDTSRNTSSATVRGNAIFTESSANQGIVTGNSYVYSPVTRPLGGTTNGQVIYYDYDGLYFHDSVLGHGVTGKWNDLNNWWLNSSATIPSPVLPTAGDDVIILSGTLATTTATATVDTIIFQATSTNAITITVNSSARDAALFNASSTNNGTIIGNATFAGEGTENNGTVTGYITRQYSTGAFTVVRDFTHNGIHWIVQAVNGATVDLTGATYSLIQNVFEALGNSLFVWNNFIGSSIPDLVITSPTTGTLIKWSPIVSWGTSHLCQYKIDSGTYVSVSCAANGANIPKPTAGVHTLSLKSTDANGNTTEKSVTFTYDNTQPVDTDCSTPLDEATRPYYYLTSNVGNCSVTASTTIRGDDGLGNFYTMGNLTGSSTNVILQNITATGAVSGFNSMNVASSTFSGSLIINNTFNTDTLSRFATTTIASGGVVNGGMFTSGLTNNGVINNGSTTPVTIAGSIVNNGTINGDFTFNASSTNYGTVNGDLTLNGDSWNQGVVNGDVVFNTLTGLNGVVTITDNTVFRGTGTTTGSLLDNRGDQISIWHFEDSSTNLGILRGITYFDDTSTNLGTIVGDAYFNDSSVNSGTINGNAYIYKAWLLSKAIGGTVTGTKSYYSHSNSVSFRNISGDSNWNNTSNWFRFAATTTPLGRTPVSGEDIVLFASTTLKSNLANDIYVAVSTTTINGAYYTVTGNIYGNGAYGGFPAHDFNLEYITVTGSSTAIGGDGNPDIDGGKGGNINVRYSTTGVIAVNGGDPLHNGGDAGTIYVLNSIGVLNETPIKAIGGDSIGCGFGGSGGNVTLVDTAQYIVFVEPGQSATTTIAEGGGCDNPPSGTGGSKGQYVVSGTFNPGLINNPNSTPSTNQDTTTSPSSFRNVLDRFVPVVDFDLNLSPFSLTPLPTFGTGAENSFSFINRIKNFFALPIPKEIIDTYSLIPGLFEILNIQNMNDLLMLKNKPFALNNTRTTGLFTLYSMNNTKPVQTFMSFDVDALLYQFVKVQPEQKITVFVTPTIGAQNYKGEFNGQEVIFKNNTVELVVPKKAGIYILSTAVTPIKLYIQVSNSDDQYLVDDMKVNLFTIIGTSTLQMITNITNLLWDVVDMFATIWSAIVYFLRDLFI